MIIFTSVKGAHEEGGTDPQYFNRNGPFKVVNPDLYEDAVRVSISVSRRET